MKIKLVVVGKLKEPFLKDMCNEYIKRLSPYANVEVFEVPDELPQANSSLKDEENCRNKEGEKILSKIKDNEYIEEQSKKCYEEYCKYTNDKLIIKQDLFIKEKEAIVTRVIKRAFKEISNSYQNFEMKHIYDVIDLYNRGTGKSINLTNSIIAENTYGDIIFKKKKNVKNAKEETEV